MNQESPTLPTLILRWALPIGALILIGPIAGMLTAGLRGSDGGFHATPLVSDAPIPGLFIGVIAVLISVGYGLIAARLLDPRAGFLCAGLTLAWAAWQTGRADEMSRWLDAASTDVSAMMIRFAVEVILLGVVVVLGAGLIQAVGSRSDEAFAPRYAKVMASSALGKATWAGIGVGVPAGLAAAFVIARSPAEGQILMAGVCGGIAAAAAARLVSAGMDHDLGVVAPFWSVIAAGVVAPVAALVMHGARIDDEIIRGYEGGFFAPALVVPMSWLAGALLGVPIGSRWVQASIDKRLG